jgi:hypothetical protein
LGHWPHGAHAELLNALHAVLMNEPAPQFEMQGAHTVSDDDVAADTWYWFALHDEIVWHAVSDVAVH